jgi:putative MATE family efflux protein
MPGVLLVMAGNGWMRAVQETRSPVRIVLIANGLSAALSPVLVYPLGLGLRGSAIANVLAQAVASALFLRALSRAAAGLRISWTVMRGQLVMGRDLILRQVGFQVAFLTAAGVASRMGTAQIAAHQIGLQLWEFTALLLDSFAIAAQSLVGAALGGSDVDTARRTAWQVARFGLYAGVAFLVVYGSLWFVLPKAFTSSAAVQHQAHLLWPWFVGMMPAAGVLFALDGVLIGAGDVAFMRTLTIVAAVCFFAPLNILALHVGWGIGGVWAGLTAFILVRFAGMVVRTRGTAWAVVGASHG